MSHFAGQVIAAWSTPPVEGCECQQCRLLRSVQGVRPLPTAASLPVRALCYDPTFIYTRSEHTDIRKTFARAQFMLRTTGRPGAY